MNTGEQFHLMGITRLDTKKRITLGKLLKKSELFNQAAINDFETFLGDNGDILLRPRTAIPTRELWLHQDKKILQNIKKGLEDSKAGHVTRVKNLDKFLKEL